MTCVKVVHPLERYSSFSLQMTRLIEPNLWITYQAHCRAKYSNIKKMSMIFCSIENPAQAFRRQVTRERTDF